MIRLGIISDSHQNRFWTERFLKVARREGYDALFHLGDGGSDARWLERRLDIPIYRVAGNCDIWSGVEEELVAEFEGQRILAVHGHLFDVKWTLDQLSYHAEERGAFIALYGHTHVPSACYVGPVLTLNPGALMDGCYAELRLDGPRAIPYLLSLNE